MTAPIVTLLVLRTSRLDASIRFYQALGLQFTQEQHGSGPIHYSVQCGGLVVELYPGTEAPLRLRQASGATLIGFRVPSVDAAIVAIKEVGGQVITAPKDSPWGRRAVVTDIDGRALELTEPKPPVSSG